MVTTQVPSSNLKLSITLNSHIAMGLAGMHYSTPLSVKDCLTMEKFLGALDDPKSEGCATVTHARSFEVPGFNAQRVPDKADKPYTPTHPRRTGEHIR